MLSSEPEILSDLSIPLILDFLFLETLLSFCRQISLSCKSGDFNTPVSTDFPPLLHVLPNVLFDRFLLSSRCVSCPVVIPVRRNIVPVTLSGLLSPSLR